MTPDGGLFIEGFDDEDGLLTLREAAVAVGVSVESVRHWVKRDQVKTVTWGGRTFIGRQSLYDCELTRRRRPQGRKRRRL